jgi:predicted DNA-binding transcriptional regulator AlpA
MRFLRHADLRSKGINYSKSHLWKLRQLPPDDPRKFPDPYRGLGAEGPWTEPQIDEYIQRRLAARPEDEKDLAPIEDLLKQRCLDKEAQIAVG